MTREAMILYDAYPLATKNKFADLQAVRGLTDGSLLYARTSGQYGEIGTPRQKSKSSLNSRRLLGRAEADIETACLPNRLQELLLRQYYVGLPRWW
jgi:hypothetical protein